jgi:hypothetical protein
MRLTFLWAESVLATAGDGFAEVEATLLADAADIVGRARSFFVHSSPPDGTDPVYFCDGAETVDGWTVTVRVGRFEPATTAEGRQVLFGRPIGPSDQRYVEKQYEVDVEKPVRT